MMDAQTITLMGGAIVSIVLVALALGGSKSGGSFQKRLARVSSNHGYADKSQVKKHDEAVQTLRRRTSDSNFALLDQIIKSALPNPEELRKKLAKTGKSLSIGEFLIINALAIGVFYLVFMYLVKWGQLTSVFTAIMMGLWLPNAIIKRMGNKRIRDFLALFPESIDTICRGLRSGLPISESIASVGRELPDPVGVEFRRISDAVRLGQSLDDAMWEVSKRLDTPEFRFFIIALAIQRETGGNLAETLGNLAELLRKRRQLRLKIRAMSAEARASAMIIGSLPFVMFALLMGVNSEYMMLMLTDIRGKIMMGFGLSLIGLGILVMKKMISFEI
jgi:tight adherence protein B